MLQHVKYLGLLVSKPTNTPMYPRVNLHGNMGNVYDETSRYKRVIGRLFYLNITHPYISFAIQNLSQYVSSLRVPHYNAACHRVRYLKQTLGHFIVKVNNGFTSIL